MIDWFRKKNCTPWENNGNYYLDFWSVKGAQSINVLEAIGPIFEVIGGPISVIIGIAGELPGVSLDTTAWNVTLSLTNPYAYEGMPCRVQYAYKRKCKRECCQFGKQRIQNKKVSAIVNKYGHAYLYPMSRTEMQCVLDNDWPEEQIAGYLDQATDCSSLNK